MPQGEIAPDPWASAMQEVGAISPVTGKPSMNELSRMSGVHATTVQRVVYGRMGTRGVNADTIEKLAKALKKKPTVVAKWVGQTWGKNEPYVPHPDANILGPRERKIVDELIRTMAALKKRIPDNDSDE